MAGSEAAAAAGKKSKTRFLLFLLLLGERLGMLTVAERRLCWPRRF